MKLDNQVCSLAQSKKLRELGITQDSLFYHLPDGNTEEIKKKRKLKDYYVISGDICLGKSDKNIRTEVLEGLFQITYSAFTVSELSVMLGDNYPSWKFMIEGKNKWNRWIATIIKKNERRDGINITTAPEFDRFADTQAEALAELLISVLEIKSIKLKDVNKRLTNS